MSFLENVKGASDKAGKAMAKAHQDAKQHALNQKNTRGDKLNAISLEYMGGYGDSKKANGILTFYRNQTEFNSPLSTKFTILNGSIANIAIEGKDEVGRRVTVTRLLLVGIFAFALKKKKKEKEAYITLELKDGQEVIFFVDKVNPMEMKTKLAKSISQVKQSSVASQVQAPSVGGIADELAKLAALKDQGVLTQAEFDKAKSELLS